MQTNRFDPTDPFTATDPAPKCARASGALNSDCMAA